MYRCLLILFLLFPFILFGRQGDSAAQDKGNQKFILKAFNKAYDYMSNDHYDSAQLWLNKIYAKVSYRKPTLFSYYLTTCQAEVYYYNNLHQLGLQESLKGENIALILNDSVLIADASNFIGLFHLNDNKLDLAKKYFKRGLRYASQPPYKKDYIDLSKPHHIYGNLAETFEKLNQPDSAIFYSKLSLEKAREINSGRGIATGALNTANAFLLNYQIDSARNYYQQTKYYAEKGNEFDVELTAFSGLAECASEQNNKLQAFIYLNEGFKVLDEFPQLNDFYGGMFLDIAMKIYKKYDDVHLLNKALSLKSEKQTLTYKRNNTQIQALLLAGIQNEKTIFNLELAESVGRQNLANTRIYVLLLVLLSLIIAFVAYRYFALQQLRLANLRSKISQDLHDEVGATLSGIAMYSYITKSQIEKNDSLAVNTSLDLIKENASEMVGKLNDIVWAVNPVQDNLITLIDRLKEFTLQIAAVKSIKVDFIADETLKEVRMPMPQKKNIYLICKEAINNAVKYSDCTELNIKVSHVQKQIHILITDNGKGFLLNEATKGNGLVNMTERAKEINARLEIISHIEIGTKINLVCNITRWGISLGS